MTKFIYKDRGRKDTLVLIPGWANDYRVFEPLDVDFNYLVPLQFSPFSFNEDLLAQLKMSRITQPWLLGVSMGGFLAADFSARHPDLVEGLILVGIRKGYKGADLKMVRENLRLNKKAYLYKFFNLCFHKKSETNYFKKNLLKAYCEELDLDNLFQGLDYLEGCRINTDALKGIRRITIIHGEHDRIAPLEEAVAIKDALPSSRFILVKDAGHMVTAEGNFNELISHE